MIARAVAATFVYSNTVDEPYHIGSAVVLWESKELTAGVQHPPLARWVLGLPLVLQGVSFPEGRDNRVVVEFPTFSIGQQILFSGQVPYWKILVAARHALLIFPALALFYVYRLGRYLADSRAAMLATLFFSFDPTLLAHSALIGTDIAGCAGFVAGLYYGLRFIARPNWPRAVAGGIALGLALSCKFSSLLLIPTLIVLLIARWWFGRCGARWRFIIAGAAICFATLWATYGFAVNPMRLQAMFSNEPIWSRLPEWVREQPIPMPGLWMGQMFLMNRASNGELTYLCGQISYSGWKSYFFIAMLVKEPIGFLLALGVALVMVVAVKRRAKSLLLLPPIVIYLLFSVFSKYQLGIRHLLPILPLMYLLAVMTLARAKQIILLIAFISLSAIETASIHPDYLTFFNWASGGASHGDRWLIDSNLDWGQDLNRLAVWLKSDEAKGRPYTIRCAYAQAPLIGMLGLNPSAMTDPPHGLFAISKNVEHRFQGAVYDQDRGITLGEDYSWLSRYPVVKRIGYSIDVYDLEAPLEDPLK